MAFRDPASRAYVWRVMPTMLVYVALVRLAPVLIGRTGAQGPLLWLLALLPALPIIAVFFFDGERIACERIYFDSASLVTQIGRGELLALAASGDLPGQ